MATFSFHVNVHVCASMHNLAAHTQHSSATMCSPVSELCCPPEGPRAVVALQQSSSKLNEAIMHSKGRYFDHPRIALCLLLQVVDEPGD